ncbi:MAG: putative lipoprotein [Parcubacteria group bacterium Gr01-1014_38]|nr:MAG: putative lipoprotein [Parcubacteria group bacterium Gr01-1014_38]
MVEKYSIPSAIVLAGVIIAGAIVMTRSSVRSAQQGGAVSPSASIASATAFPKIALRPVDGARDHIRGTSDARVTLVEYSDLECPFCKQFHVTLQQAFQEYGGKIRWVYRHFPLDTLHPKARKEAEASECAGEQGKFWEYADRLFEVTPSNNGLDPAQLPVIARDVGLDVAGFETCLKSGKHAQRIQEDLADAEKAGGQGTPYTVILGPNDLTIPFSGAQPYENLKPVLDKLLAES